MTWTSDDELIGSGQDNGLMCQVRVGHSSVVFDSPVPGALFDSKVTDADGLPLLYVRSAGMGSVVVATTPADEVLSLIVADGMGTMTGLDVHGEPLFHAGHSGGGLEVLVTDQGTTCPPILLLAVLAMLLGRTVPADTRLISE